MELYIIRHGETDLNRNKILQGVSCSSRLTEKGKNQVREAGKIIKNIDFACVYTSDLARCIESSEIIIRELAKKPPLVKTSALRERNYGLYEGYTWEEIRKKMNADASRSIIDAPPHGESLYQVRERCGCIIEEVKNRHNDDENILFVTHNGTIMMLFLCLLELGIEYHRNFYFDNGSVSHFHLGDVYNKLIYSNLRRI